MFFEKKAKEMNTPLIFAEDSYRIISSEYHPAFFDLQIEDEKKKIKFQLQTDLNGIYQQKNIVTTLAATDVLKTSFSFQNEKNFGCA